MTGGPLPLPGRRQKNVAGPPLIRHARQRDGRVQAWRRRRRLLTLGSGLVFVGLSALFSSRAQGAFTAQTSNGGTTLSAAQLDAWVPTTVTTSMAFCYDIAGNRIKRADTSTALSVTKL